MSEGHYASCAEVLLQSSKDDLEAILDPQNGYAPQMRNICSNLIGEYEERPDSHTLQDDIEILRLEENTWSLLQAVMPARKTEPPHTPTAKELLLENPYTPTSTIIQAILDASPLLSELFVIREWLQESAPAPARPEANTGYWKFTKHTIMQSMRTGQAPRDGLVSDMDPDATNREDGAGLAGDDASYEKSLLQALYGYVRAGRIDDAVDVCRDAHQPWRAASIRGSLLFQWRSLSTHEDDAEEEETENSPVWSGNRHRVLWKSTCVRAALSSSLSDPERLLYAAIIPVPETANILKTACRTWEDHLWAEISVMCEDKASRELARHAQGSFWEGGVEAADKGAEALSNLPTDDEEDEEWEREVVRTLDNLQGVAVLDGPPADHAFHFSQLYIILNRTDRLLDVFAKGLTDGTYAIDTFEYDSMCRFFTHFCLYLKMIEIPVPPQALQIILESYIGILEQAGQRELIALYAGALGDNAVERYAAFLVSLGLSADKTERRKALERASEHGLDIERVACATAERTVNRAFEELLPRTKQLLPSLINLEPPPTDAEMLLLRSIEWTTFRDSTYTAALEQATEILRYFLGAGRVQAAHSLLVDPTDDTKALPDELATLAEPEEIATEYLHYRQFFVIWETLEEVVNCQAEESMIGQSGASSARDAKAAWVARYRGLIDEAYDQILKLLTTEWLVSDVEEPQVDRKRRDLIRIRQIYVPELILRLHSILYSSRHVITENLKRALELANIVADSRYRLYQDFRGEGGRSLAEYLGAVRQAVLAGLEHGGSDPFRIVSNL
ncbi:hypothetical protein BDN70DRAFT_884207 [Pholiota conissans]|uniref:Nuclear pore complex protein n=1 Tax=Pholiota conissans TaxID=109636 RepID=A0A9P6CPT1_9AGAR|nr:hypothetical protein BDN70DRAFT_884207 [Pholiota conissans]